MSRRRPLLGAALLLLVGCGKKPAVDSVPDHDSATHTIAVADSSSGKWRHTESVTTTVIITVGGKSETDLRSERSEYTETHLPPIGPAVKRLTRAYAVASETVNGQTTHREYSGKTVVIEKVGDLHTFSVGGRQLATADAGPLVGEFSVGVSLKWSDRLPGRAVRIGEEWAVRNDVLRAFVRSRGGSINADQSSLKGKLISVYTEADKQWGRLEYRGILSLDEAASKAGPRTMSMVVTHESPIDGKAGEMRTTQRITANWLPSIGGESGTATLELVDEKTAAPVGP